MAAAKGVSGSTRNMVFFYIGIFLFVLVSILPLLWVFKMSIITRAELIQTPPTILPADPTGENYAAIFAGPGFQRALINSMVIAGTTTVICLLFGSVAAYAI